MSKKDFTGGLSSLLGDQPKKETRGRPKTSTKIVSKASEEGTKEDETRATFIVRKDILEKLKAIAYWERKLIKDVIAEALLDVVAKYESKGNEYKPKPKQ